MAIDGEYFESGLQSQPLIALSEMSIECVVSQCRVCDHQAS